MQTNPKQWLEKRWFILERDRLRYSTVKIEKYVSLNENDSKESLFVGFIPINKNTTITLVPDVGANAFSIQNRKDPRVYLLQADATNERDQWVDVLRDRAKKVDPPSLDAISLRFEMFYMVTTATETYAEFQIKVTNMSNKQNWTVLRRYSDLRNIHQRVNEETKRKVLFPPLICSKKKKFVVAALENL